MYIQSSLIYWAQVSAAGALTLQNGPGLLTIGLAASVYTITMPANFTVPRNRRFVALTGNTAAGAANQRVVNYDEAASTDATVVVTASDLAVPAAANCAFQLCVYRVQFQIGNGVG